MTISLSASVSRGLATIAVAIEHDLTRRRNAAHNELTTTLTV